MKVQEALSKGKEILTKNDVEEVSLKVKILLADILKIRKDELILKYDEELLEDKEKEYFLKLDTLSKDYPLEYLTKTKEFMKMNFFVDERVLIPRSDTENLVEEVIRISKEKNKKDILELCTGSGIISISLAKYLENVKIIATDISKEAISVAKKNMEELKAKDISFIESDMFENIKGKFDIIVSNPPYIKRKVIKKYKLEYEPNIALDGGEDGLKFYRIIINQGYDFLKKDGIIALEIGYDQKEEVEEIARATKKYKKIYTLKDLSGNDRVVVLET